METGTLRRLGIVLGLVAATIVYLSVAGDLRLDDRAGLQANLPESIGSWRGRDIVFCQARACAAEFIVTKAADDSRCQRCDGELHGMSIGERKFLPADTEIARKVYEDARGRTIALSIALSGIDRTSIHPPEWCLKAQGYKLVGREVLAVPFANRGPLKLALLDLERARDSAAGAVLEKRIYAFWYVSQGRETPSHIGRLGWVTYDAIVHRITRRWAYVGLLADVHADRHVVVEMLAAFIGDVYPGLAGSVPIR
jgi:hypothetical protein